MGVSTKFTSDFTLGNDYHKAIIEDTSTEWNHFEAKWKPIFTGEKLQRDALRVKLFILSSLVVGCLCVGSTLPASFLRVNGSSVPP